MSHLHTSRIAFSFLPGTFDIGRMRPELWEADEETASAHVALDARWPRLLRAFSHTGVLMACAPSGPATLAAALEQVQFEPVPNSPDWVCLQSGMELCPASLGGVIAAIEELDSGQQTASLQFFDRQGEGCLKLLATDLTHIAAFEDLVRRHATARHTSHFGNHQPKPLFRDATPDPRTVRSLWHGLRRTLPENSFPGQEGVSRRRALAVAGSGHAWQVSTSTVASLLRAMTLADAPLAINLRNEIVFLSSAMYISHWSDCACGTTFFSPATQLTLRPHTHQGEAWVTRFIEESREILSLELYDPLGSFCVSIGLRPEASLAHQAQWKASLVQSPSFSKR